MSPYQAVHACSTPFVHLPRRPQQPLSAWLCCDALAKAMAQISRVHRAERSLHRGCPGSFRCLSHPCLASGGRWRRGVCPKQDLSHHLQAGGQPQLEVPASSAAHARRLHLAAAASSCVFSLPFERETGRRMLVLHLRDKGAVVVPKLLCIMQTAGYLSGM